ncbi:MAG: hypothetical protein PHP82_03820 [Candidatus ainarchaeum sp.]|nr:hypothetical protein [Candidatus ainarchaeum sp.]
MKEKKKILIVNNADEEKIQQIKTRIGVRCDSEVIRFAIHKTWEVVCNERK